MNIKKIYLSFVLMMSMTALPVHSADKTLAYLANSNDYWQVWLMKSDGSEKQQLTTSEYDKSHISWFPSGHEILVNGSQGQLTRINTQTLEEKSITLPIKGTLDAVVSPNGKQIAFSLSVAGSIDNNHIWVVDTDGHNLQKITNMNGLQHEPVWSIDGEWIYFLSGKGDQTHNIWRVSLKTKATQKITVGELYNFDVTFSRYGDMAFSSNRDGDYDIWLQSDHKLKNITKNKSIDSRPALSADGNNLVFESLRNGQMNIWHQSLTTNQLKQLTFEKVGARYPIWSH